MNLGGERRPRSNHGAQLASFGALRTRSPVYQEVMIDCPDFFRLFLLSRALESAGVDSFRRTSKSGSELIPSWCCGGPYRVETSFISRGSLTVGVKERGFPALAQCILVGEVEVDQYSQGRQYLRSLIFGIQHSL